MRKVYVTIEVSAVIEMDEGIALSDVIDDLDYEMVSTTDGAEILDVAIGDYIIEYSK